MAVDRGWTAAGVLALVALLTAPSCLEREAPVEGVLLVTLDTTRADRIGCYGYAGAETPSLDALAGEAVRFADATATLPTTLGSHATMFTGQVPPVHGIRYNGMFQLAERSVTVAETLRDAGFATGAVPAAYPVAAESGIGQGFEVYEDLFAEPGGKERSAETERSAADVSQRGIEWLGKVEKGKRFFLWLHYYGPHYPYAPPFPYSAKFRDRPYDGEIAYVDRELGKVFAALKAAGRWERTLVIVAGDHGEGLYQHDEKMHAHLVYETTLHVPLLVKPAGAARARVAPDPVSLADVAPTILDLAAVKPPGAPPMQGVSLRPSLRGERLPRRSIYFESLAGALVYGWSPLDGIRRDRWKLIRSGSPELYDLETDPEERTNVYEMQKEVAADLMAELDESLLRWKPAEEPASTTPVPVDARKMEQLASLGYLGGAMTPSRLTGASPREKIHLEPMIFEARERMMAQDYAGAFATAGAVLAEDPANRYGLQLATTAAARLERFDEAASLAERTIKLYPEYAPAWIARGDLYVRHGQYRQAADTFHAGLEKSPSEPALAYRLALALLSDGRTPEASAVVEKAIAAKVEQPSFLVVRALCRARSGDPSGAREALSEAIAKGYRNREILEREPLLAPLRRIPGFRDVLSGIPADPEGMTRALRGLALPYVALFVMSGACALTYEVVWSRLLVNVFGVTAFAVSTVLVSFMGGMALGAMLLGRAADRAKRPLRMFALLEAGIGAYALLLPTLLHAVDFLYGAILPSVPDSVLVRSLVRFAFCLLLLLVPTILMGGTLPALGRGLLRHGDRVGLGVGILYFVNTLGAAAGCALAGFWLIPYLGLSGTVALAVAGNALVAATAWLLDRGPSAPPEPEIAPQAPGPEAPSSWPLVVAFGSGLTALAFEVVWFRVMVQVFGSTVYSFSAMLAVFLLGLALGSILLGPLADETRRPLRLLVATQGCVALFSILGSLSVNHLPELFLRVLASMGLDFAGMNRTKILLSFLTLLLPAAAFGGTFPICVRLAGGHGGTGSRIGRVYAWNTLGAILGSFGAGFLLLPTIGAEHTLDLVILVSLLLAFATLLAEPGPLDLRFALPAGLAIVVVTAVLLVKPPWDRRLLGAGVYFEPGHYYDTSGRVRIEPVVADYRLTTYTEGYNDTILSFRSPKGKFITVNGSTTASDQFDDMFAQRMLGHLPMALHPGPVRSVCIVGLGAGVTAGAAALHGAEKVTVVELEKGVFAASRFFAKENHGILDAPSAEIRIDDGRNFLKLTKARFDVISSAPNFPSLTGSGALYSRDYFELCRRRLAPGGIMCQFAPTWRILPEDLKTIVGSFADVFPHVRVFSSGISLVMLGREEPFPPTDVAEVSRRVGRPEVAASLREIGMRGPIEMLSLYAFDEEEAKRFAAGAPRNTDDRPRIEFFAPRALFSETIAANLEALREQHLPAEERARRLGLSGAERDDFFACAAAQDAIVDGQIAVAHGKGEDGMQLLVAAASAGYRYAAHLVASTAETSGVRLQNRGNVEEARQQFLAALRFEPDRLESLVGAGYLDIFSNRVDEADALLSRAVELYPEAAGAIYRLGLAREVQGRVGEAETLYRRAIELKPILAEPHGLLGRLLLNTGRAAEALPVLDRAIDLGETTEGPRLARAEAMLALGRTRDALREARSAALRFPTSAEAFDLLARSAGAAGETGESEMAAKRRDALTGRN